MLAIFIKNEYLPTCRKDIGVSSLPDGHEFYQACIRYFFLLLRASLILFRFHTSDDLKPQKIHDISKQVEMKSNLSIKDFNKKMKEDEINYSSTSENYATINGKIGPKITQIFHTGVLGELEIKSDIDEKAAWYQTGTADRPSVLSIATSDERR